jgi:hypothetical protein
MKQLGRGVHIQGVSAHVCVYVSVCLYATGVPQNPSAGNEKSMSPFSLCRFIITYLTILNQIEHN